MAKRVIDGEQLQRLLDTAHAAQDALDDSFRAIELYIGKDLEELDLSPEAVYECTADYVIGILDGMGKKGKGK